MAKTNHSNVYLVRHTALDTLRVAKVIRKADMDSDTILREARLIKNLKHSHIPVIYDIEEDDISICIIEEYISGKSLRSYINDTDNIKTSEICDIAVKLCDILEYLHNCDNEIIHLDIKPDNIIIDEHNNVKLIDFGSSIHKAGLTQVTAYTMQKIQDFIIPSSLRYKDIKHNRHIEGRRFVINS